MSTATPPQLMTTEELLAIPDDGVRRELIRGQLREYRDGFNEAPPRRVTTAELLSMPDDGIERWIIGGEPREGGVTRRNRRHGRVEGNITGIIWDWLHTQPTPRGELLVGEAGFVLGNDPENTVGIDVAYISAQAAGENDEDVRLVDAAPVLAVEILSPSDQYGQITEKIQTYRDNGVALVWVVEPVFRTVTVYRPDALPQVFNTTHELNAEPHLPGFKTPVSAIFDA